MSVLLPHLIMNTHRIQALSSQIRTSTLAQLVRFLILFQWRVSIGTTYIFRTISSRSDSRNRF